MNNAWTLPKKYEKYLIKKIVHSVNHFHIGFNFVWPPAENVGFFRWFLDGFYSEDEAKVFPHALVFNKCGFGDLVIEFW